MGKSEFVRISLYENNVIPDLTDALPGNDEVLPMPQQTEAPPLSRYDDGADLPTSAVHLHITYIPQPTAVTDIDHLLALQIGKPVSHNHPS